MLFVETSAKTSSNIFDAFAKLANQIRCKIIPVKKTPSIKEKLSPKTSLKKTKNIARESGGCC